MTSQEILANFIAFYEQRGHKQIPNVSLLPEGDPTLLFVNSGMFPLVPYLLGQPHPLGTRLVNVQRSMRVDDIDEIGDLRHTTAFHMLGNWSLGDYFKQEQLPWVYTFLIEKLGLDPQRLYATVFEGDEYAPKDVESIELIKAIFAKYNVIANEGERIFACPRKSNWWQRGDAVGELGGPDSEIYYYLGKENSQKVGVNPADDEDNYLEIGNSVFMQYKKTETGWVELPQKNVDFGGGLERIALVVQGKEDIFETDNFWPIIEKIQVLTKKNYHESSEVKRQMRILADHSRAATFLAMDGIFPSNKDQGYVLRRILRRMIRAGRALGVAKDLSPHLVGTTVGSFAWLYPELNAEGDQIKELFTKEEANFRSALEKAEGYLAKHTNMLSDLVAHKDTEHLVSFGFDLYQSQGFPFEEFEAYLKEHFEFSSADLRKLYGSRFVEHQKLSRTGSASKFTGGLADNSETVVKYHTVTHLLQAALRQVLGEHVRQLGSNITGERLRFDFPNAGKLDVEQLAKVENLINSAIDDKLSVKRVVMPKVDAEKTGALFIKGEVYPDSVSVYFVGETLETALSKEFCGGPHVDSTAALKHIKLFKQESIGEGKVRIYAKFE